MDVRPSGPRQIRCTGCCVDLRAALAAAPDEIGLDSDDGIATARFPALDAFEQESVVALAGQLQIGGNRCFEIGYSPRKDSLSGTAPKGVRESRKVRLDFHPHIRSQ